MSIGPSDIPKDQPIKFTRFQKGLYEFSLSRIPDQLRKDAISWLKNNAAGLYEFAGMTSDGWQFQDVYIKDKQIADLFGKEFLQLPSLVSEMPLTERGYSCQLLEEMEAIQNSLARFNH